MIRKARPAVVVGTTTGQTSEAVAGSSGMSIDGGADGAPDLARGDATVILPSAGRIVTRAVTRCAECGSVTVHIYRDGDGINGSIRRGACRHVYRVRVRRVLSQWRGAA